MCQDNKQLGSLAYLPYLRPTLPAFSTPLLADPNRCERGFTGNTIGQANAVSNTALDLRFCDFKGANLSGKTLSGVCVWRGGGA